MSEQWRAIPGWPYEASNLGRIRRSETKHVLSPSPRGKRRNYLGVSLCFGGRCRTVSVHALVAAAFLGPRPDGAQVNHKNGVGSDNRAENLEYTTPAGNVSHAYEHGLKRPTAGAANGRAKLTASEVSAIRSRHDGGESQGELARAFGVHQTTIGFIVRRERWAHVTEEY